MITATVILTILVIFAIVVAGIVVLNAIAEGFRH